MATKKKAPDGDEGTAPSSAMPMPNPMMGQMAPMGQMGQMMPGQMPGQMMGQMPQQMMGQMMPGQMPQQPMMQQQMPGQMMGQMQQPMMQQGMPGMMPQMGMGMGGMGMAPVMQQNPMMMMLQLMQGMQGGFGGGYGVDASAVPFGGSTKVDADAGLEQGIVRPARFENRIKTQEALPLGNVLDLLCLTEDGKNALGGVPVGCTMVFVGPPGKGKTRTALAALSRVATTGKKVAFVVAEEGFHDESGAGRDDLCSRLCKVGMAATGLDEANFEKKVLDNLFVLEAQYHKHNTWDDFVAKYRYLVEKEEIDFVVIDSLNMIDPTKKGTADNLSALKTYNHERGVTCICIGQIKDTGEPVGGEALQHTADVVFLLEEMGLSSKEIAEFWGGKYRDKISVLHIVKSVTTPTFQFPVRVGRAEGTGELIVSDQQPADYAVPKVKG
jgi:KaiC/GvpD/RAD55 family RecA-like ATPase